MKDRTYDAGAQDDMSYTTALTVESVCEQMTRELAPTEAPGQTSAAPKLPD